MTAKRKFYDKPPAGPLPDGFNVHRFPAGRPIKRLTRNQKIRAAYVGMIRAYNSFFEVSRALREADPDVNYGLGAVDVSLDRVWDTLKVRGIVEDD